MCSILNRSSYNNARYLVKKATEKIRNRFAREKGLSPEGANARSRFAREKVYLSVEGANARYLVQKPIEKMKKPPFYLRY